MARRGGALDIKQKTEHWEKPLPDSLLRVSYGDDNDDSTNDSHNEDDKVFVRDIYSCSVCNCIVQLLLRTIYMQIAR